MRSITTLLIPFLLFLNGCAGPAEGPPFTPFTGLQTDEAVIYVYRPESYALSMQFAIIEIDGVRVATLLNNGYVAIPTTVGSHKITQTWYAGALVPSNSEHRPISVNILTHNGSATYIRLGTSHTSPNTSGMYEIAWELREVTNADASDELKKCRRIDLEKKVSGT